MQLDELASASPAVAARSILRLEASTRCDVLAKAASGMRATERAGLVSSIVARLPAEERASLLDALFAAADAPAAAQLLARLVRRVFVVKNRRARSHCARARGGRLTPLPRDRSGPAPSPAEGDDDVVLTLLAMLPGADRVTLLRHVLDAVEPDERARALAQTDAGSAVPRLARRGAMNAARCDALKRALDVGAISPALFAQATRELGE